MFVWWRTIIELSVISYLILGNYYEYQKTLISLRLLYTAICSLLDGEIISTKLLKILVRLLIYLNAGIVHGLHRVECVVTIIIGYYACISSAGSAGEP